MITTVNNIDAFATQLGIDVAQSTELKRKTKRQRNSHTYGTPLYAGVRCRQEN